MERTGRTGLARQYFQYGRWKRVVGRLHPRSLRWRHLVPPTTVVAVAFGIALGVWVDRLFLVAPVGCLAGLTLASVIVSFGLRSRAAPWLPVVFATLHLAWGLGFLVGVRGARRESTASSGAEETPRSPSPDTST